MDDLISQIARILGEAAARKWIEQQKQSPTAVASAPGTADQRKRSRIPPASQSAGRRIAKHRR